MMKMSLIFKICGLFLATSEMVSATGGSPPAPAPHGGENLWETSEPLSILHGEYQIDDNNMRNYRPTWASVWSIIEHDRDNGVFHISTWPPKYCHAIYICPLLIQDYSDTYNFRTVEPGVCEHEYIKFYPHAKKLFLKQGDGKEEVEKFWTNNRLVFDIDQQSSTDVHVLDELPESQTEFTNMIKTPNTVKFNFAEKELLILTNSRMCQVNKIGVGFKPFFRKGIQKSNPPIFPQWLTDGNKTVQTDYLPPVKKGNSDKKIDLLSYLMEKTPAATHAKLLKTCEPVVGWRAGGRKKPPNAQFKRVSVSSYHINLMNGKYDGASFKKFTLNVERCHWFRLWFSSNGLIKDYKQMTLSDTVDFFLNEGFYISPESDEAHPLPGVNELSKFTFVVSKQDKADMVDMTYGEARGNPIYHDQFSIKPVAETSFYLHIIKAPGCEINLESRSGLWKDDPVAADNNMWKFGKCEFSYFD